jgi:hypothetical protein
MLAGGTWPWHSVRFEPVTFGTKRALTFCQIRYRLSCNILAVITDKRVYSGPRCGLSHSICFYSVDNSIVAREHIIHLHKLLGHCGDLRKKTEGLIRLLTPARTLSNPSLFNFLPLTPSFITSPPTTHPHPISPLHYSCQARFRAPHGRHQRYGPLSPRLAPAYREPP